MKRAAVSMLVIAFGLAALQACGKDDKKDADKKAAESASESDKSGLDEGEQVVFKMTQDDLAEIKAELAKSGDVTYKCAGTLGQSKDLAGKSKEVDAVLAELDQICNYDVPLAKLETAVAQAEEARKAKPDEQVLSECYSADYTTSLDELNKKHADDDKVKALVARFETACPPKQ